MPYCERARRILWDFDMAGELYAKYKKLDCLYFIPKSIRKSDKITVTETIIKKGERDYFTEIIERYKESGKTIRVQKILAGLKTG